MKPLNSTNRTLAGGVAVIRDPPWFVIISGLAVAMSE
jgi:hypothetical protein